jgi:hypothetical protein
MSRDRILAVIVTFNHKARDSQALDAPKALTRLSDREAPGAAAMNDNGRVFACA